MKSNTWHVVYTDGTAFDGEAISYLHLDQSRIASFAVGPFRTSVPPLHYRRRVAIAQGQCQEVCHVVAMPNEIVFVFDSGDVVRLADWQPESKWFYPIQTVRGDDGQ